MALSSTIVWEVRADGSNNNGGGYKTGASGTDYTQQAAAQYALTGCTSAGAGAVIDTASAAADMVGNVAQVISGTNFTAGFYEITSVSVGVSITVDANCTTGAGSSGVVNIGGALATIGKIGSASANMGAVAGNLICVKSGNYTLTATDTMAANGTLALPIRIAGYASTRPTATTSGDGYLGRTNGNGPLSTTNMPAYTYNATYRLNCSGNFYIVENLNVSVATTGTSSYPITVAADSVVRNCKSSNPSTNASAGAISVGSSRAVAYDCDALLTGASGGETGINALGSGGRVIGCRVNVVSATAKGISVSSSASVIGCTVYKCGGTGIYISSTSAATFIAGNTIVGNVDGIKFISAVTPLQTIVNNMITDNSGYGIDFSSGGTSGAAVLANNRLRGNGTNFRGGGGYLDGTSWEHQTTGSGTSADYTDYAGNDFRLVSSSVAVEAGLPDYASIGALQLPASGGGGGMLTGNLRGNTQ